MLVRLAVTIDAATKVGRIQRRRRSASGSPLPAVPIGRPEPDSFL